MLENKIGFIGEGWGGVSVAKGLKDNFTVEYLSDDEQIVSILGASKHRRLVSISDFTAKILVCAGYKPIIDEEYLKKYTIVNIHYSLLPKYRGLHSSAWAVMNGENELGLSFHLMNNYIDDGDIIHQKAFDNDGVTSLVEYMQYMNDYVENNVANVLKKFINGEIIPQKQDKSKASWVGKRSKRHNLIDFNKNNVYLKRLFRVLSPPYPYPYFTYKKEEFKVLEYKYHFSEINTDTSRILNIDNEGVWVKISDGYCILKHIVNKENQKIDFSFFKIGTLVNND